MKKEIWASFAAAAMTGIIASEGIMAGDEVAGLAEEYADEMMKVYINRTEQ